MSKKKIIRALKAKAANHLSELRRKHAALEDELRQTPVMSSTDSLIKKLKRQKFDLKAKITRLENPARLTAPDTVDPVLSAEAKASSDDEAAESLPVESDVNLAA